MGGETEPAVRGVRQDGADRSRLPPTGSLSHLQRVQASWDDPTDWTALSTFGFYCLEACVVAATLHLERQRPRNHPDKAREARRLATEYNLPDIGDLLVDLNDMRKHEAYGDVDPPDDLHAKEIATAIEEYVEAMREFITR